MFMQNSMTETQKVMRNEFSILQIDFGQMEERAEKLRAKAISLKDWKLVEIIEQYWLPFSINPILINPM